MLRIQRRKGKRSIRRLGASAVEFAVVAPFLFLVVMGMIEIGRAMMIQHVLSLSAREGAREAVLMTATTESVEARVDEFAAAAGPSLDGLDSAVSPDPATAVSGEFMTVTVTLPLSAVSNWGYVWFGDSFNLSATAVMRREGYE